VFATAGWFHARDPVLLRLMLRFGQKAQLDAAKFEPFPLVIYGVSR
jgi:hypothetical protein